MDKEKAIDGMRKECKKVRIGTGGFVEDHKRKIIFRRYK
jgi:hypothetical protein